MPTVCACRADPAIGRSPPAPELMRRRGAAAGFDYARAMSNVIPHNWEVPQVFRGRLGTHAGRQRVMSADGHLLLILHEVPGRKEATERGARLYWRKPDGTWQSTGS